MTAYLTSTSSTAVATYTFTITSTSTTAASTSTIQTLTSIVGVVGGGGLSPILIIALLFVAVVIAMIWARSRR